MAAIASATTSALGLTGRAAAEAVGGATASAVKRGGWKKAGTHVMLYEDVPGIGTKGEIVLTSVKCARNYLVPFRLGYYVPRSQGKPILPKDWRPKLSAADTALPTILPAFFTPTAISQLTSATGSSASVASSQKSEARNKAATDLIQKLAALPPLTFSRPLIDAKDRRTFGSVTPEDIATLLRRQHEIQVDPRMISVDKGRIKEVGDHVVSVRVSGGAGERSGASAQKSDESGASVDVPVKVVAEDD